MAAATGPPAPAAPYTKDYKDTAITVWWLKDKLPAGTVKVRLFQREFPKPWPDAHVAEVPVEVTEHVAEGLFPTSTFEFKLQAVFADGSTSPAGPATAADTLAAGCVPKDGDKKKSGGGGCTVQ